MTNDELIKLAKSGSSDDLDKLMDYYTKKGFNTQQIGQKINVLKGLSIDNNVTAKGSLFQDIVGQGVTGGMLNVADSATKLVAEQFGKYFETQFGKEQPTDTLKLFELIKKNGLDVYNFIGDSLTLANEMVLQQLKAESELRSEIATKTGLIGELGDALREDMKNASIEAARYGITLKDIGQFYVELVNQTGRFNLINRQMIEQMLPLSNALDMNLSEFAGAISDFEKVGIGAQDTIDSLSEVTTRSLSYGLSAKSIAKGITENIGMLNSYGFKNGLEGLEKMVRKSKEFRFSMSEVFTLADKIFDPENAIELVANLQMIGGAIGDFNDPLKLMYMATNDIEGLQKALIDSANSIATYNEKSKTFEITGVNLRRAKAEADALGMSYKEFSQLAIASAERSQAALELNARGLRMDEDEKDFLINLARMEDGEMKITIPESLAERLKTTTKLSLGEMTDDIKEQLLLNKQYFETLDPKDVAMQQLTETQRMAKGMDVIVAYTKIRAAEFVKGLGKGLYEDAFNDLQKTIDEYSKDVQSNANNNIEGKVKQSIVNVKENLKPIVDVAKKIMNPIDTIREYSKPEEKKSEPLSETKTMTVNHTVTVRTEDTLRGLGREFQRNPLILTEPTNLAYGEYINFG
jgi:hypothetical protein